MSVKGELVLASDSGHRYIIQVDLIATDNDQSTFEEWTSPSLLVPRSGTQLFYFKESTHLGEGDD